jgi:hypothetical protein
MPGLPGIAGVEGQGTVFGRNHRKYKNLPIRSAPNSSSDWAFRKNG